MNIGYGPWPEIAEAAKRQVEALPFFSNWVGFAHEACARSLRQAQRAAPGRRRPHLLRRGRLGGERDGDEARAPVPSATRRADPHEVHLAAKRLPRDDARSALDQREPGAAVAIRAAASGLFRAPMPYRYRCPYCAEKPGCTLRCADEIDDIVGNEGGDGRRRDPRAGAELGRLDRPTGRLLRPRPRDLRRRLLLVVDEVICGFGRVGDWFGSTRYGIQPDL